MQWTDLGMTRWTPSLLGWPGGNNYTLWYRKYMVFCCASSWVLTRFEHPTLGNDLFDHAYLCYCQCEAGSDHRTRRLPRRGYHSWIIRPLQNRPRLRVVGNKSAAVWLIPCTHFGDSVNLRQIWRAHTLQSTELSLSTSIPLLAPQRAGPRSPLCNLNARACDLYAKAAR
ncbi:hypothetical protein PENSPDRAFT_90826 [Peniophora sp. CONT]|nr:hypothetical protein PENSPDRAFT_90826 [Peniophora sp. CONT]